ncbi:tyrosine phosphatase family-domain-containing protein [Scheffersomyces coipomensis]|uniref:tyrosine phosphatase family-domain-containing protein n=1 Tax=Scheffersomyces coipomensis TaxID=1788519 RepID=UPI00315DC891
MSSSEIVYPITPLPTSSSSKTLTLINDQDQEDLQHDIYQKYNNNPVLITYHPQIQYVPPLNFSLVEDRIYRSGFPMPINYPFLEQLGLKTIIYLGDLDIYANYLQWISTTDIQFHNLLIESSQEPFNKPEEHRQAQESLTKALQLLLNKNCFPILIHSNKGKHRTGLLVGLMRKLLQGWCMSGIFEEYEKFAMGKSDFDLEFIELWQPELWINDDLKPDFVRI